MIPSANAGVRAGRTKRSPVANAHLSVRDVHLLIRELETYLRRLEGVPGRDVAREREHARKLVDKLYQVRWS